MIFVLVILCFIKENFHDFFFFIQIILKLKTQTKYIHLFTWYVLYIYKNIQKIVIYTEILKYAKLFLLLFLLFIYYFYFDGGSNIVL